MNSIKLNNIIFILLLSFTSIFATNTNAQSDGNIQVYGNAVKEIFVKGSLGGENLFLVLGFEKATRQFKKNIKNAVDAQNLKEIGNEFIDDVKDVADSTNNADHDGDFVNAARNGLELASESAKFLIKSPLRSLKKIPSSYKVSFENAREAYYETDNSIAASVKYAGHAVWANVKGAYFLVIEAPAKAILGITGTVLGLPLQVAGHAIGIGLDIVFAGLDLTVSLAYHALKAVINGAVGVLTMGYAGITTAVAITATTVAAGIVGTIGGIKWIASQPVKLFYTGKTKVATGLKKENIKTLARAIAEDLELNEIAILLGFTDARIITNSKKYTARVMFNNVGDKKAAVVKMKIVNGEVVAEAAIKKSHFKELFNNANTDGTLTKKEFRKEIKELLEKLVKSATLEVTEA